MAHNESSRAGSITLSTFLEDYPGSEPEQDFHESAALFQELFDSLKNTRVGNDLEDIINLMTLKQMAMTIPQVHPAWQTVDDEGNNILHVATLYYRHRCVEWLMTFYPSLSTLPNHASNTAWQALQARLRTQHSHPQHLVVTDDGLYGHSMAQTMTVMRLHRLSNPTSSVVQRLMFGCTCGHCLDGFLSIRARCNLLCQARDLRDSILEDRDALASGGLFLSSWGFALKYQSQRTLERLYSTPEPRIGFANMLDHVAGCLHDCILPTEMETLSSIEDCGEPHPDLYAYLIAGGTPRAATAAVFAMARVASLKGHADRCVRSVMSEGVDLPRCDNDDRYDLVAAMCGLPQL